MTAVRLAGALFVASIAVVAAQTPTPFGEDTWHHVVYENPTMRLFSVNVAPGTMTGMHEHQFDIVTVSMNEGTPTRVQAPGQKQAEDRAARALGNAAATEYTGKPGAHRVENVGKRAYQLFAVENRKKGGWSAAAAVTGIGTKMVQESRAFRIYDINLALNTSQSSHTHTSPTVAILISGKAMSDGPDAKAKEFAPAPVGLRQLDSPGQWIVIPPGDRHHLVRLGTTDARVIEVEVR
jgi:predicted metal-dependent enzyme (double-stranded beta helix superfamily)